MRTTALHQEHLDLGARMTEFAGFHMPVQYSGIVEEHLAVRGRAGMFDVSHMGEIMIAGEGAGESLGRLCTRDVRGKVGKGTYVHLLDEGGRIIDDTIVFRMGEDRYMMVPNAGTQERVLEWVGDHALDQEVVDLGAKISCIAVQGPRALDLVDGLARPSVSSLRPFSGGMFDLGLGGNLLEEMLSPGDCFISRTGYTGEEGVEIFVENPLAVELWRLLLDRGEGHGLLPAGLGARDTLRLERGLLLSGTDFDGSQTTLQTGPPFAIGWDHEFIGREALLHQKEEEYPRLAGFQMVDRGVPRHGYSLTVNGEEVGRVTSGTHSPCLERGIGMGYLPPPSHRVGTEIEVIIRGRAAKAEVVETPFYGG
ncbi:MAG: glycine cleavage system aminomethyltransferase GcvT [Methanomassiliicoccales archaeon]